MSKRLAWVRSCKGGKEPVCEYCSSSNGHLEVYQLLDHSMSFDNYLILCDTCGALCMWTLRKIVAILRYDSKHKLASRLGE